MKIYEVTEGTPLPEEWARGGHAGGIVEGSIVVAGGNNWSKDKSTKYWLNNSAVFRDGHWVSGPVLPKPLAYAMYSHDNRGLYIAGGTEDGTSFSREAYFLNSLKEGEGWKQLPQLPRAISYGAGAILNDKFYVACGSLGTENTNMMWVLDVNNAESKWIECQSVPGVGRMFPSLVSCGKYLYLLGGLAETEPLRPLKDIYRYDPDENKWIQLGDLPLMGYAWVSQPIDNNHLIITGRADGNIDTGIWIIDLRDLSMKQIGNLIIPSTTSPLINIANKQWWLIGGEPDANKNRTEKISVINLK
jgi:N-acetylneuraminic acid mutarotase